MTAYSDFLVSPEREASLSRTAAILLSLLVLSVTACPVHYFGPGGLPPARGDDLFILILFFYARRQNAQLGRRFFSPTLAFGMCLWLFYILALIGGYIMTYLASPAMFLINDLYRHLMFIRSMIVFLLVGSLHIQPKHLWQFLGFVAFLGAAEALLALLETVVPGIYVFFASIYTLDINRYITGPTGGASRAIGTIYNPNYLGAILGVYASAALALGLFSKRSFIRVFGLGATVFIVYAGIFLAQSRTAIFSLGLVIFSTLALSVALPKGRWTPLLVMIGLVIFGAFGVELLQNVELPPRIESMVGSMRTQGAANGVVQSTGRVDIWKNQLEVLAAGGSYWVGGGVSKDKYDDFDSGFLHALMMGGLFGLAAFCGFYIFMIWNCLATFFKARYSAYAPIVLTLLGCVWAMLAFEVTAGFVCANCLTVLTGVFMGLIVVVKREVDREVAARQEAEIYGEEWQPEEWSEEALPQEMPE